MSRFRVRGRENISLKKDRASRSELRVNEDSVRQTSTVAGLLPLQVLLPDLAELVFWRAHEDGASGWTGARFT